MLSHINPFVRFAGTVNGTQCSEALCYAEDGRLFLCREGNSVVCVGEEHYSLSMGEYLYIPPSTPYAFQVHSRGAYRMTAINFDFDMQREALVHTLPKHPVHERMREGIWLPQDFRRPIHGHADDLIDDLLKKIADAFLGESKHFRLYASAHLKLLLLRIAEEKEGHTDEENELLMRVLRLSKQNSDMRSLAAAVGYHPNHLCRLIKRLTGVSAKEYLIRARIRESEHLLASTDKSITEIAECCGFSTPSYFAEMFRKSVGTTPREYRARIRSAVV